MDGQLREGDCPVLFKYVLGAIAIVIVGILYY